MPGPIQTIPQGLLGLLQLKQTGENPNALDLTVQPNVELLQFWAQRVMQESQGLFPGGPPATATLTTAAGPGTRNFLIGGVPVSVPNNETWYCDQVLAYSGSIAATDNFVNISPGYTVPGGGVYTMCPLATDVISARARFVWTNPLPRPIFIPPGAQLTMEIGDMISGGMTFTLFMRAARLPI